MIATVVGRLSQAFLLLLVMSVIGIVGIHSIGNPVFNIVNAETATAEDIRNATIALGLDQPLWWQYLVFMGNVVTGRFGTSYIYHLPAFALVMSKLPATFELATTAMLIAAPFGTLLGLHAGRRQGGLVDRLVLKASVFALSIPSFWLSMMLILVGAIALGWLPPGGRGETARLMGQDWSVLTLDGLRHVVLPALALAVPNIALIARLARAGTIEVEGQDFIRFCRAKGLSPRRILFRHTLPNIATHRDDRRHAVRRHARLCRGGGDDLRLAGRRHAADRCHPASRPARRHGDADLHLRRLRPAQRPRRPLLCRARPARAPLRLKGSP
jgi:peptide/nickel transport system permease protein